MFYWPHSVRVLVVCFLSTLIHDVGVNGERLTGWSGLNDERAAFDHQRTVLWIQLTDSLWVEHVLICRLLIWHLWEGGAGTAGTNWIQM